MISLQFGEALSSKGKAWASARSSLLCVFRQDPDDLITPRASRPPFTAGIYYQSFDRKRFNGKLGLIMFGCRLLYRLISLPRFHN